MLRPGIDCASLFNRQPVVEGTSQACQMFAQVLGSFKEGVYYSKAVVLTGSRLRHFMHVLVAR